MFYCKIHPLISAFFICWLTFYAGLTQNPDSLTLRSHDNQADYLIISADSFRTAIAPLQVHRQLHNLNVLFVNTGQIYREFADSLMAAKQIRHFISYALQYWQTPKPKYILLLGDSEIIPPFRLESYLSGLGEDSVAIDEFFVINQFDIDDILDAAIGRIPASTLGEANLYSQKVIHFEDSLSVSDYNNDFLVLADSMSNEPFFYELAAENFMNYLTPFNFRISRIDIRHSSPYSGTVDDFITDINSGTIFLNYIGAGIAKIWSADTFFTSRDIGRLHNDGLPFIMTATTGGQTFDYPDDSTIVEGLLFHPQGGAVANFASVGYSYLNSLVRVNTDLYRYMLSHPDSSLGTDIFRIKEQYTTYSHTDNDFRRMTLLGDPALKMPPNLITSLNGPDEPKITHFRLKQNYPNPFNPVTTITFDLAGTSEVTLKIYNILGEEVATLLSASLLSGSHNYEWDASNFPSGIYLYRLRADNYIETKKMILMR